MIVQKKRIILLLWITCLVSHTVFSQPYSSKDNYTGAWETPGSWIPVWAVPQTNISGHNITINGYITVNGTLSFRGTANILIINDTLVIKGDLLLDNNNDLKINDNGILIVMGNLTINNQTTVTANGYLIVAGNLTKNSSQGTFTSNDNPVGVFIGGTISPAGLTNNNPDYQALNCTAPVTTRYPNSTCSHGNMTDLGGLSIYSFFKKICSITNVNTNISICAANTINLTSASGTIYNWSGPNGFTSSLQNPSISNANPAMSGAYTITVTNGPGCMDKDTINVSVNPSPAAPTITANGPTTFCTGGSVTLTSSAGTSYLWSTGVATPNINVTSAGSFTVQVKNASGCQSMASPAVVITVNKNPIANAGPDQELTFVSEVRMKAELSPGETGEWSLVSGSGGIADIHSPTTMVSALKPGANIFLWKVGNGNCEAGSEVKITIKDLFVPSVITPDGDGKNDYFKISENIGRVELIVFNKWGIEEYKNADYKNDWDGRNNKGTALPFDTYFYIIKFENGKVIKGAVLIKR